MSKHDYIIAENRLINSYETMTYEQAQDATLSFQAKYKSLAEPITQDIRDALDDIFAEERAPKPIEVIELICEEEELQEEEDYKEEGEHLEWIYNRMLEIHGENPNNDYMIKFKEIINNWY